MSQLHRRGTLQEENTVRTAPRWIDTYIVCVLWPERGERDARGKQSRALAVLKVIELEKLRGKENRQERLTEGYHEASRIQEGKSQVKPVPSGCLIYDVVWQAEDLIQFKTMRDIDPEEARNTCVAASARKVVHK
jgi:hypothetical protein